MIPPKRETDFGTYLVLQARKKEEKKLETDNVSYNYNYIRM